MKTKYVSFLQFISENRAKMWFRKLRSNTHAVFEGA